MEGKKRRLKWQTSYRSVTTEEAEKRLGFRLEKLQSEALPIEKIIGHKNLNLLDLKSKVYERIVEYLDVEGYPTMASDDFKEININDLVYTVLAPVISNYKSSTSKPMRLLRKKEIVSVDSVTGGDEEFVVVNMLSVTEEKFVLVIEAKRDNLGSAIKQCLLSMKDMRDIDGSGTVYGFVTVGDVWQMIHYDGTTFGMGEDFKILFPTMATDKERWMKDFSVIVDCLYFALDNGSI